MTKEHETAKPDDVVDLEDDAEAVEFPLFDPTVKDLVSWEPPQSMLDFLFRETF